QLLAGLDRPPRLDEDARLARVVLVLLQHRLAVGVAAEVDPAGAVAAVVGVDHPLVVQGEQEGVSALDVAAFVGIHFLVGAALALVLDDALALADRLQREHALAVDSGIAGDDLAGHSWISVLRRGSKSCIVARSRVKSPSGVPFRQLTGISTRLPTPLFQWLLKSYNFGTIRRPRAPRHQTHRLRDRGPDRACRTAGCGAERGRAGRARRPGDAHRRQGA